MASTTRSAIATALAVLVTLWLAPPAWSIPALFSPGGHLTHRFGPGGAGGTPTGDFVEVNAALFAPSTGDPLASIVVTATQGSASITLPFFPFTAPVVDPTVASYVRFIPLDSNLLGAWSIVATDSTGTSDPVPTAAIAEAEFIPLVTGITVSDSSSTPTLSWIVPDLTGFDVDLTQIRVIEVATDLHVFFTNLQGTPTSFTVPAGVLNPTKEYVFRVGLLDQEASPFAHTENRSDAFSGVFQVPGPIPLILLAVGVPWVVFARRRRA